MGLDDDIYGYEEDRRIKRRQRRATSQGKMARNSWGKDQKSDDAVSIPGASRLFSHDVDEDEEGGSHRHEDEERNENTFKTPPSGGREDQADGTASPGSHPVGDLREPPRDLGELDIVYGEYIRGLISAGGVRDVEDAHQDILERMMVRELIRNYRPEGAAFKMYLRGFVRSEIRRHLTNQRRRDAREITIDGFDPRSLTDEIGEVDYRVMLAQIGDPSTTGGMVLPACASLMEHQGSVTGRDLGERLNISPQMACRHLKALDQQEVRRLLMDGE